VSSTAPPKIEPEPSLPTLGFGRASLQILRRSLTHVARVTVVIALPVLLLPVLITLDPYSGPRLPDWEVLTSRVETLRFQIGVAIGVAALWLLACRAWRFGSVGLLLCGWAVLPTVLWPGTHRQAIPDAPSLRVLSINLGGDHGEASRVLGVLRDAEADVFVLQEYTPRWQERLAEPLAGAFPHRREQPRGDNFGMAIFSRVPWSSVKPFVFHASRTPQYRLEFEFGTTRIVLYAIHLLPPTRGLYEAHRQECAELLRRLAAEDAPTAAIGDFNFVDHGPVGRALHDLEFFDAHGIAGSGRGATWPVHAWLHRLPGIRIDHIYVGAGLTSTEAWVGARTGSDHRPIGGTITLGRE